VVLFTACAVFASSVVTVLVSSDFSLCFVKKSMLLLLLLLLYRHLVSFSFTDVISEGWTKKWIHKLVAIILSDLNRFSKIFHWKILLLNLQQAVNNQTTPCICCYTTLWNINVQKQTINNKFSGSVATYLRCGGVVNNWIKKGLLLSLSEKFFFKFVNICQSYKQERGCLMHFLRLLAVWWPGARRM